MWMTLKKQLWQLRGMLIAVPSVAGAVIGLRLLGVLQPVELAALDQFFRLRPAEARDERIVIIEITEADLQKAVQWPMPDEKLARLLNQIKRQKPRAIGLDLYRDLPVEPGHAKLVQVFESTPYLIGIQKVVGESTGMAVNAPPTLKKNGQVGANDLLSDGDGRIRRSLLSLRDRQKQTILSLGAQLAILYLQAEGVELKTLDAKKSQIQLGKTVFEPLSRNDGGYVGLDAGGYQILGNFRNLRNGFRSISMTEVLEGKMPEDFARDRIVLIGITAESAGDNFLTPYAQGNALNETGASSGVAIHADVTSQLISAALEGRPLLRFWADPIEYGWILGWAVVGAGLCWVGRFHGRGWNRSGNWMDKLPWTAIAVVVVTGGLVGGSYLAFLSNWWIPVVPAAIALLGSAAAITGYTAWSAAEMRQTFGRYLTDEVVANLLETPEGLKLGGERRIITVLISDLRGFSAISEQLSPENAVSVVNLYLEAMTNVINQYQGTINEFLGDGIFVIFGAPVQRENDPERAVACAIAMQLAMKNVNQQLIQQNLPTLEMGIGVHTGEAIAGNIGSTQRAKYTVIGNTVNLASRIESYTVGEQVLISDSTFQHTQAWVQVSEKLQMRAKGIREALTLYEVSGMTGMYNLLLPKENLQLTPLHPPLVVQYRVLEGKSLADEMFQGTLLQLSQKSAELQAAQSLEPLTNLVISVLVKSETETERWDVYAKVVEVLDQSGDRFHIRFTSIPATVKIFFSTLQTKELNA